jgi:hypothetical protein
MGIYTSPSSGVRKKGCYGASQVTSVKVEWDFQGYEIVIDDTWLEHGQTLANISRQQRNSASRTVYLAHVPCMFEHELKNERDQKHCHSTSNQSSERTCNSFLQYRIIAQRSFKGQQNDISKEVKKLWRTESKEMYFFCLRNWEIETSKFLMKELTLVLRTKGSAPPIDPKWSAHAQIRALSPQPQQDSHSDLLRRRRRGGRVTRKPVRQKNAPRKKQRRIETPLEMPDDDYNIPCVDETSIESIEFDSDEERRTRPIYGMKTLAGQGKKSAHESSPDLSPSPQQSGNLDLFHNETEQQSFAAEELLRLDEEEMLSSYREEIWWDEADPEDLSQSDDRLLTILRRSTYHQNSHLRSLRDADLLAFHKAVVTERLYIDPRCPWLEGAAGSFFLRHGGHTIISAISSHPTKVDCLVKLDVAISRGEIRKHVFHMCLPGEEEEEEQEMDCMWYHYGGEMCFSEDLKEVYLCQ